MPTKTFKAVLGDGFVELPFDVRTIGLDTRVREVEPPADLKAALARNPAARAKWEALSFTHKREHAEALLGAKKPETRTRRLQKTIEMLTKP